MSTIKGTRFAQIPEWVLDAPISDRAVRLYGVLARIVATERQDLPGRKVVAGRMHCSVDSLDRATKELVDLGAVVVVPTWADTAQTERGPNDYELRFDPPEEGQGVAAPLPPPHRSAAATSPRPCPEGGRTGAAVVKDKGSTTDRTTERSSPLPPTPSTALVLVPPPLPAQAPAETVFQEWVTVTGRTSATVLTQERKRKIDKALRDYPLADVLDAVRGWRYSPHHCGDNENGTVYNDIDLLLRNAGKIEFFRDLERRGPIGRRAPRAPVQDAAAAYLQSRRADA